MNWKIITLLLCTFGVLKEFRPSEPYLYQYEHVTLNISEEVLNSKVYPIWTYSYMVALIPVFLLSDLLLYKPVILMEALSYVTVWSLFVFGRSVTVQQIIEIFYGCATATEIAYFSYIYVKVDRSMYKRVTSLTRAAILVGKSVSYFMAQALIGTHVASYYTLNVISLVSLCLAFCFGLTLPSVSWRRAYAKLLETSQITAPQQSISSVDILEAEAGSEKTRATTESSQDTTLDVSTEGKPSYFTYAKAHFRRWRTEIPTIYRDRFVVKWSMWWAMATCANLQIGNYTQTLWGTVQLKNRHMFNGITEAVCPLIAIPIVLLMQRVNVNWQKWGESFLCIMSLIDGALLLVMSGSHNIIVLYAGYTIYRVIYQAMITIAQFNLANRLVSESFGLVFGLNTFVALVMQSILTLIVADSHGLALSIRPQFVVYSCFHGAISIVFVVPVIIMIIRWIRKRRSSSENEA